MKGDCCMKKKIIVSNDGKLCLGIELKLTYFVNSKNKIELRRLYYLPKSDEFGYNYIIPKAYINFFQGKELTKDLQRLLEMYDIAQYSELVPKINEYNNSKLRKNILKQELLLCKMT